MGSDYKIGDYKIGDWVAIKLWEDRQGDGFVYDEEVVCYGKIMRIIGEKENPYHPSIPAYDGRKFECLPEIEFDEDGDPLETFSVTIGDVDYELTMKYNRNRKLKELGI